MLKNLAVIIFIFTSISSQAMIFAESASKTHKDSIYGKLGFGRGGFTLGATWERNLEEFSYGAYFHNQGKDDDNGGAGLTAIGGFIGIHFFKRSWDFYLHPGFGIEMAELASNKETALGPSLNLGVKYQYSSEMAFGIERSSHFGWFAKDFKGLINDTLVATIHYGF